MAVKKVLLAPLDWGLGHTTRCMPLARHLQQLDAEVFFAGTDTQISFFRKTFPQLHYLPLAGYGITYSRSRRGFMPHLLGQLPQLFRSIRQEHHWLLEMAEKFGFNGILSDNRYGLWHPEIPSVFITHQPGLKTGWGTAADKAFAKLHQRLMARFPELWLVDVAEKPGLSGALSHPAVLPRNAQYIGLLSRFEAPLPEYSRAGLLVLLSGPEPQRSLLSEKLWQQVQDFPEKVVFVEGREDAPVRLSSGNIRWFARLSAEALLPFLEQAGYVVARSGYSTLMDAAVLSLKLILIPTPGQTEQEYLGQELFRQQKALCYRQEDFELSAALSEARHFPFRPLGHPAHAGQFVPVLESWYRQL